MAIDWISLLTGIAIGITFMTALNLIAANIRYKRAQAQLSKVTDDIEKLRAGFQKHRDELLGKIDETKKGGK